LKARLNQVILSVYDHLELAPLYNWINFKKSPASGASNVNVPRPMSQVGITHEVECA